MLWIDRGRFLRSAVSTSLEQVSLVCCQSPARRTVSSGHVSGKYTTTPVRDMACRRRRRVAFHLRPVALIVGVQGDAGNVHCRSNIFERVFKEGERERMRLRRRD